VYSLNWYKEYSGLFFNQPNAIQDIHVFFLQWKIQYFEENISGFYLHLMDFNFNFNSVSCYCFLKKKKKIIYFPLKKDKYGYYIGMSK